MSFLRPATFSLARALLVATAVVAAHCGAPPVGADASHDASHDTTPDTATSDASRGSDAPAPLDAPPTDATPATDAPPAMDAPRDTVTMDAAPPRDAPADVPAADTGPSSARQTMRVIGYMGAPNGFYEYLPPGYGPAPSAPSPLMLFWHGLGEDGDGSAAQLPMVLRNGPPMLISTNQWPGSRPFIVLSPQNPSGCPSAGSIRAFLRWAFAHYNVDRARVYLTGLSCGAIGSWSYIDAYLGDNEITAAVLIAGNGRGPWDHHMCGLGSIGIWAFAGALDETITPDDQMYVMTGFPTDNRPDGSRAESMLVYNQWVMMGSPMTGGLIGACPPATRRDARLTIYPDATHNSWARTYDLSAGHDIYAWLLGMSR